MTFDAASYASACLQRLEAARRIADTLKHNGDLHRLAMKTVFVLEDVHESFWRMQDEEKPQQNQHR